MISLATLVRDTFAPQLQSMAQWLDKGAEHANAKGLSLEALLEARLAPDMFPLATQVVVACHHAYDGPARLMGQTPPATFEQRNWRFDELKARTAAAVRHVEGLDPAAFGGAAERRVVVPLMAGMVLEMDGAAFLQRWTFAHFYFHTVTTYDILRSQGVELGKRDFVGHLLPFIRQA